MIVFLNHIFIFIFLTERILLCVSEYEFTYVTEKNYWRKIQNCKITRKKENAYHRQILVYNKAVTRFIIIIIIILLLLLTLYKK